MDTVFNCLFLWPIQAVVEFLFLFFFKWTLFKCGVTIVLLSVTVNTMLLPLYNIADRWQKEDKDLQESMRAKLADIRAVFRGDERQMLVATYYRQRGYHPLMSLRSSVGLLMQVPFFLAAYLFLSHSDALKGSSYLFLPNLGQPDGLLTLAGVKINLLPLVMTAINLLSALLYTKGMRLRDQVQLFVLAAVFLVLLYQSPSGLVLYWTVSNLFSLGKNLVLGFPRPGRTFHILAILGLLWVGFWTLTLPGFPNPRFFLTTAFAVALIPVPWLWRRGLKLLRTPGPQAAKDEGRLFMATCLFLFFLAGTALPLLLIATSPVEFGSLENLLLQTILQAFSLFFLVPLGLRALAPAPIRRLMTWSLAALGLLALAFAFVLPPMVAMNTSFTSTDPQRLKNALEVVPTLGLVVATAVVLFGLVRWRRVSWLTSLFGLGAASLLLVSVVTVAQLPASSISQAPTATDAQTGKVAPVFPLTRKGHNQFLFFLDGASAMALPDSLETVPGLKAGLAGFTWYQNTVSYSSHTLFTVPAMMGGPGYSPEAINARKGEPLVAKVNEALKVMPKVFSDAGERVVLADPSFANLEWIPDTSIYWGMKNVTALNLKGVYKGLYLKREKLLDDLPRDRQFDYDILVRLSLFRMAFPALRPLLYFDGSWWKGGPSAVFQSEVGSFSGLTYLTELCYVDDGADTANFFFNETNHDGGAFDPQGRISRFPVEVPAEDLARFGDNFTAKYIYGYRTAMGQVVKWLDWLKVQGVFDNTRIVIVADHGRNMSENKFSSYSRYRPLLLVKDYGQSGDLRVDDRLQTNADVPAFMTAGFPGAVPHRPASEVPVVHEGPFWPRGQNPDGFVFTEVLTLSQPDARVDSNWVTVKP